jgi:hypothetical protein
VAWSRSRVVSELDLVALDQRVREQLGAHPLDLGPGLLWIAGLDLEIDEPPDPRVVDGEPEVPQRRLDRLALWVEDAGLGPDEDCRLQRRTARGFAA